MQNLQNQNKQTNKTETHPQIKETNWQLLECGGVGDGGKRGEGD